MKEAITIVLGFPWHVQFLLLLPMLVMGLILMCRPNLKDPDDHFYYTFTSKLDSDLRKIYWANLTRNEARTSRENVLQARHDYLRDVTGDPKHISNMSKIHRAAWAYLWKRTNEVLR